MSCSPLVIFTICDSTSWDGSGLLGAGNEGCESCVRYRTYSESASMSSSSGGGKKAGAYDDTGCGPGGSFSCSYNYRVSFDPKVDKEGNIIIHTVALNYDANLSSSSATSSTMCFYSSNLKDGVTKDECCTRTRKSGSKTCGGYGGGCGAPSCVIDCEDCQSEENDSGGSPCPYLSANRSQKRLVSKMKPKDFYSLTKESVDKKIEIIENGNQYNASYEPSLGIFPKGVPAPGEGCEAISRACKIKIGYQQKLFAQNDIKSIKGKAYAYYGGSISPCCLEKIEDFDGTIEEEYSFKITSSDKSISLPSFLGERTSFYVKDLGEIKNKENEDLTEGNQSIYICSKIEEIEYLEQKQ